MRRLENMLSKALEAFLAVCLLVIFVLVVALVVTRYVFNSAIPGATESITIVFVYMSSIGGALAAGRREHVAIPFAIERLPPQALRWVNAVGLVLVALINAVMVWFSFHWISITGDYLMPSTGLPRIVAQLSIPVGCGLAAIYCLVKAVTLLMRNSSPPPERT
ncbi:MAG: TRAP-type C4-dicarboxylate transport system permease small subunit [Verrucomicrobiales bacterium]